MVAIYVKEATSEDAGAVAEMIARLKMLNEELDPHFKTVSDLDVVVKKYVEEILASEDTRVLLALDAATGEPVGLLVLRKEDRIFYEPRYKAVITDFYVKPKYRRRRVGSILLEKAIEHAKDLGAGIITVVYPAGNTIAETFYERAGFKDLQVEKYKPLY